MKRSAYRVKAIRLNIFTDWELQVGGIQKFNIIYSKNSPSSTGGRWIAKNNKERLFGNKIHGIIELVDKIIIQKKDWFYGKYGSQCTFSVLDVLSLIMVVKYRRKVINDPISERAKEIWEYIAPRYGIVLEEWNHDIDHVHVMFRAQPKYQCL